MTEKNGGHECLITCSSVGVGGTEQLVATLSRQLSAQRWKVRTVFAQRPESDHLLEWCRNEGVLAEASPAVSGGGQEHTLQTTLALWSLVRADNRPVVNLHYGDNHISLKDVLAVRLSGLRRCVVTVHHPTSWQEVGERKRKMTYLAARLSHLVVVNSQATRRVLLEAGVPDDKIRVIPCGLRPPQALPDRSGARSRLGLSQDAFVVSALGRAVRGKGVPDLIEALSGMVDDFPDVMLVVAGDGPDRADMQQEARRRLGGRAVFLGFVDDTADVYAAADVFALPSHLEGFGQVYIEAAFHGVPSIGASVGGVPEVILDGETGLLVPVNDPPAIAAAIRRLHDDAGFRRSLGDAARRRAYAEFTDEVMANRYAQVFDGTAP